MGCCQDLDLLWPIKGINMNTYSFQFWWTLSITPSMQAAFHIYTHNGNIKPFLKSLLHLICFCISLAEFGDFSMPSLFLLLPNSFLLQNISAVFLS